MEEFESLMATSDVELLKRAWRNEKSAPEILQFQAPLVQRSREQIQFMVEPVIFLVQTSKRGSQKIRISSHL
ncbi:hypothetical protein SOVF_126000 [Spinacia oleracea]|nr:hypothetical protein SOVF_126000 [Spinacia oleracea]